MLWHILAVFQGSVRHRAGQLKIRIFYANYHFHSQYNLLEHYIRLFVYHDPSIHMIINYLFNNLSRNSRHEICITNSVYRIYMHIAHHHPVTIKLRNDRNISLICETNVHCFLIPVCGQFKDTNLPCLQNII